MTVQWGRKRTKEQKRLKNSVLLVEKKNCSEKKTLRAEIMLKLTEIGEYFSSVSTGQLMIAQLK